MPDIFYVCKQGCKVRRSGLRPRSNTKGILCVEHGAKILHAIIVCDDCRVEFHASLLSARSAYLCPNCKDTRQKIRWQKRKQSRSDKAKVKRKFSRVEATGKARKPDCSHYEECIGLLDFKSPWADKFHCEDCKRYEIRTDNYDISESGGNSAKTYGSMGRGWASYTPSTGDWG